MPGIPSERQAEALELLSSDLSASEVALKMGVKPHTIGTYVTQSADKLGVRRTPAVIMLACSSGLIPLALGRASVPAAPFRELVSLAEALKSATSLDLPALQARAKTTLAALATQNTPTWALCNRSAKSDA
ncbi:helix-turn-helix transcriptional regulator [Catenulispora sp. NL8]|uniref:Helix-turn-helix transcriptional regulator n=1 Tax=Catenulispora pinistramenti TaxID=2705254 RepID=A0ABS5KQP6_9ACTN|nr:helix-turn-helix transcriptional regulator [Catenulispora pinistramenti]MBS2548359.1 helix-turn-helix transcriptional regulator [Catenulispora pinistramenti]